MKILAHVLCAVLLGLSAAAQEHASHAQAHSVALVTGLGDLHHPVSTKNSQAQQFFDQGLRFIYAFNHDEAARSFQHAAELDPKLAMAYWGVAEAVGPNYNDPADPDRYKQAHGAVQKALDLSEQASASDQAYIQALAKRFPADPKSDLKQAAEDYRDAMRQVVSEFPDDLDAATLFAEAGMNLHPWGLWHVDGTPEAGTDEIVSTLESVMKRDPNHLGAIHYYIHTVEASAAPERALAGANKLAALAPGAGHIVHMPAHIYIRTGDYEAAVKTNQEAAIVDRAYIKASGAQGIYPMMYYSHNLHFVAMCAAMNGNYAESRKNADLLIANVGPHVKDMPPLEGFMTIPVAVDVRFHKWDEILKMPAPSPDMQVLTGFWHFAHGMALAGQGKVSEAEAEHKIVTDAESNTPEDAIFAMPVNNKTKDILVIARDVLGAMPRRGRLRHPRRGRVGPAGTGPRRYARGQLQPGRSEPVAAAGDEKSDQGRDYASAAGSVPAALRHRCRHTTGRRHADLRLQQRKNAGAAQPRRTLSGAGAGCFGAQRGRRSETEVGFEP